MVWRGVEVRGMPVGIRRIWPLLVVRGALMGVFGILTLVWPALSAVVLISIFGIYAIIDGLTSIAYGRAARKRGNPGGGWVMQGVIAILAGAIALFWPEATGVVVLLILGFWALLIGVVLAAIGLRLRRTSPSVWLWPFILGAMAVIFGLVLIFEPADALVGLATVLGVFTLIAGVALVFGGLRLRRLQLT
jgi:uncharacterized membrane protein HdeD (DUF308 family)